MAGITLLLSDWELRESEFYTVRCVEMKALDFLEMFLYVCEQRELVAWLCSSEWRTNDQETSSGGEG